jgi:hypothetical protein
MLPDSGPQGSRKDIQKRPNGPKRSTKKRSWKVGVAPGSLFRGGVRKVLLFPRPFGALFLHIEGPGCANVGEHQWIWRIVLTFLTDSIFWKEFVQIWVSLGQQKQGFFAWEKLSTSIFINLQQMSGPASHLRAILGQNCKPKRTTGLTWQASVSILERFWRSQKGVKMWTRTGWGLWGNTCEVPGPCQQPLHYPERRQTRGQFGSFCNSRIDNMEILVL